MTGVGIFPPSMIASHCVRRTLVHKLHSVYAVRNTNQRKRPERRVSSFRPLPSLSAAYFFRVRLLLHRLLVDRRLSARAELAIVLTSFVLALGFCARGDGSPQMFRAVAERLDEAERVRAQPRRQALGVVADCL